jgi:hypothetical protein
MEIVPAALDLPDDGSGMDHKHKPPIDLEVKDPDHVETEPPVAEEAEEAEERPTKFVRTQSPNVSDIVESVTAQLELEGREKANSKAPCCTCAYENKCAYKNRCECKANGRLCISCVANCCRNGRPNQPKVNSVSEMDIEEVEDEESFVRQCLEKLQKQVYLYQDEIKVLKTDLKDKKQQILSLWKKFELKQRN